MVDDTLQRVARRRGRPAGCVPRLVAYRERVAHERKREFRDEAYWGKPVPGFGDPQARLVGVGLAPAAHGSNRTGRIFTGDRSAAFLVRALYDAGYASQPTSVRRGDGLSYRDFFLTAGRPVRPAGQPPPTGRTGPRAARSSSGSSGCSTNARALLAFGGFAWDATLDAAAGAFEVKRPQVPFAHGAAAPLGRGSRSSGPRSIRVRRTRTRGKLTHPMLVDLLGRVRASWDVAGSAARQALTRSPRRRRGWATSSSWGGTVSPGSGGSPRRMDRSKPRRSSRSSIPTPPASPSPRRSSGVGSASGR